jgi:mycothiol synthase
MTGPQATADQQHLVIPGVPRDLRARFLDPAVDYPVVADFMAAVNLADGHNHVLSADEVAIEWRRTPGFEPSRDAVILEDARGTAALLSVDAQVRAGKVVHWVEGWVRPDRRREGIGRALLRWAERHAAELVTRRESQEPDLPQVIGFGALETIPAAMAFAASTDYAPIRYGFQMRRPLSEPIPDFQLPPGIEIRPVLERDHRRIFDADVEAFLDHWEPRARDDSDFEATFAFPDLDTSLWRVAWDGDEVAGSVMNAIFPEENARTGVSLGWLEHVSVRKRWRGRGIAKALIASSLHAHRDRGVEFAALGVDGENPTGALALYESLGFRPHEKWINHRKPLDVAAILGSER